MYEYSELVLFIRPRTQTAALTPANFCPNLKTQCDMTLCRPLRSGPRKLPAGGKGMFAAAIAPFTFTGTASRTQQQLRSAGTAINA